MKDLKSLVLRAFGVMAALILFSGCDRPASNQVQGYVEGEFVYVASPFEGQLETLSTQRGAQVNSGDLLFALNGEPEKDLRDMADHELAQARASLEDLKKGKRPPEIQSVEAQLSQARDALDLASKELARQQKLIAIPGGTAQEDLEKAQAARDEAQGGVAELEAELQTARLSSREDQIAAAEANVRAMQNALDKANWDLSQKKQNAPRTGLVFDTLYREGEWVAAGHPVVVLLPPENIKVRAFVSETRVGAIHPGDPVSVRADGMAETLKGKVSYISTQAEYTPPVIYSQDNRAKLVFMVEAVFDAASAAKLHPGQPVDVQFGL